MYIPNRCDQVNVTYETICFIARSISEEFSSGECGRYRDEDAPHASSSGGGSASKSSREREEKEEETIKVFDGNNSLRRRIYRVVSPFIKCTYNSMRNLTLFLSLSLNSL